MNTDFLNQLNDAQRRAAVHTEGASMVIAGAGSGKTRVLTYRVAYLIRSGADPFKILALTFTNKAAREMKDRITRLVGAEARNVWMGTFHSIFARVLRVEGHRMGYTSNYSIYDTQDSRNLVKAIIKELNLDNKVYTPNYVHHKISIAKNNLISPASYNQDPEIKAADRNGGKPQTGEIYTIYNNRLKKADAMDFDDLLFNTYLLFEKFPEVMVRYQHRFSHILVDEYQDTNVVQYRIVKMLAANNENLCVVGDDAQSIYAFRGANIRNILNFKKDYPEHALFKLEQNYRSTSNIVNAANSIIRNNKDQIFKKVWTSNEDGSRIRVLKAKNDTEEGRLIVNAIFEHKMNQQMPNNAFAILYRTNAQSRSFEESLRKLNIPYRIYGGMSFYKRKEIKDLLAYFRLAINNKDGEALNRIINYPARGIGKTTMEKAVVAAKEQDVNVWDIIENPVAFNLKVNSGTRTKLENFATMIKSFMARLFSSNAYELARHIAYSSGMLKEISTDQTPEGISRLENLEELLNAIKEFTETREEESEDIKTLDEFMQDVALLTDADDKDKEDRNHVSLMTVHAAKGLEFPYVYVVGLEENLFPSIMSLNSRADLEEERRLFYVAVTRAMKAVTISYAENRYRWGDLTFCEPSRFIEEIDAQYIDQPRKVHVPGNGGSAFKKRVAAPRITPPSFKGKRMKKLSSAVGSASPSQAEFEIINDLQSGMVVEHQKFGQGKVLQVEGTGGSKKAMVFFQSVGQKNLLLKFARLKIIQ